MDSSVARRCRQEDKEQRKEGGKAGEKGSPQWQPGRKEEYFSHLGQPKVEKKKKKGHGEAIRYVTLGYWWPENVLNQQGSPELAKGSQVEIEN